MADSIELIFDPGAEAAIVGMWQRLADAGLPSQLQVTSPTNRPHVTLLAADRIGAAVDGPVRSLAPRLPLTCVLGAAVVFAGPRRTLARLVVASAALLELHDQVYRSCLPHLDGEPFAHCRPGRWTPHATLGRRFTADDVGAVFARAQSALEPDLEVRAVGVRRWDGHNRVDHLLIGGDD